MPSTQKAIRVHKTGDFDVVQLDTDVPVPTISETQVLVKNSYFGINFVENYFRAGLFPAKLPLILGREGAGKVVEVGSKVTQFAIGDSVGYISPDSYAEYTAVETSSVTKLPHNVSEKDAAASLVAGLTALTFLKETYPVKKGDYILVYSAAGGVGSFFVQLGKLYGAHVIGVVSTEEKAKIAREHGAEFVINYKTEDIAERVNEITNGVGANAVFDGVGKDTWQASFDSVARKGTLVSYGTASGPVPPVSLLPLAARNIKIACPSVLAYLATAEEWEHYSSLLLQLISEGKVNISISKVYPFSETGTALKDIASGKTTGKLVVKI